MTEIERLAIHPLTPERWQDFEILFGPSGACAGCWCMWWRVTGREFARQSGEGNRQAMRTIVAGGRVPGLLAYVGERAAGWCSVAPREEFPRLDRSPLLKPLDDRPVWSVVCLFVRRDWRGRGLAHRLVEATVGYARERGAETLEAYPVNRPGRLSVGGEDFRGTPELFRRAGFREAARRNDRNPIFRLDLGGQEKY